MGRSAAVALVVVLAFLAGCAGESAGRVEASHYVALGDSYASGAGLLDAGPGTCPRSPHAYPSLVARELEADLVDVTCGGASSEDVVSGQPRPGGGALPAQLDAVSPRADLVTVGFGLNDGRFLARVLVRDQPSPLPELVDLPEQIGADVRAVLAAVRGAAPDARVLVVGYPQPVPATGSCSALPLSSQEQASARALFESLGEALRDAAAATGATYVDVTAASEGHDVCAGPDAWLTGAEPAADQRAAFHPLPRGQAAVARLVLDAVG